MASDIAPATSRTFEEVQQNSELREAVRPDPRRLQRIVDMESVRRMQARELRNTQTRIGYLVVHDLPIPSELKQRALDLESAIEDTIRQHDAATEQMRGAMILRLGELLGSARAIETIGATALEQFLTELEAVERGLFSVGNMMLNGARPETIAHEKGATHAS